MKIIPYDQVTLVTRYNKDSIPSFHGLIDFQNRVSVDDQLMYLEKLPLMYRYITDLNLLEEHGFDLINHAIKHKIRCIPHCIIWDEKDEKDQIKYVIAMSVDSHFKADTMRFIEDNFKGYISPKLKLLFM